MSSRFTSQQFKSILEKSAHKTYVPTQVKKTLEKAGLSKFLYQSASKAQVKKALNVLKEKGAIKTYRTPGAIVRAEERKFTAEAETKGEEKPKEKMTIAEMRKKMQEEQEKKERTRKMMAEIYQRERVREAEKAGTGPTEPAHTTSALKPAGPKPTEEKPKPAAIDLPID